MVLFATIAGVLALAFTTSALVWILERETRRSAPAERDLQRVEALALSSHDLLDLLAPPERPENGSSRVTRRLIARCQENLDALRMSNLFTGSQLPERVHDALQKMVHTASTPVSGTHPSERAKVARYYAVAADAYRHHLERLIDLASTRAAAQAASLAQHRDRSFWIIALTSALNIVLLLLIREWAVRRLVRPFEALTREITTVVTNPTRLVNRTEHPSAS